MRPDSWRPNPITWLLGVLFVLTPSEHAQAQPGAGQIGIYLDETATTTTMSVSAGSVFSIYVLTGECATEGLSGVEFALGLSSTDAVVVETELPIGWQNYATAISDSSTHSFWAAGPCLSAAGITLLLRYDVLLLPGYTGEPLAISLDPALISSFDPPAPGYVNCDEPLTTSSLKTFDVVNSAVLINAASVDFGGLVHVPIGGATLSLSGSTLEVRNVGSSGQDGVAVQTPSRSSWSSRLQTAPATEFPVGATLQTLVRGNLLAQPTEDLITFTRRKLGADFEFRVDLGASAVAAGARIRYEVYQDCELVDSVIADPDAVLVSPDIAKGPGDPLGGIDVGLIDKGARPPAVAGGTKLEQEFRFTLPGRESVSGDELRYTMVGASSMVESIDEVRILGRDLGTFTIESPRTGVAGQVILFGLPHSVLGFSTVREVDGWLEISELGGSCYDGVAIELAGTAAWRGDWRGPDLATLPQGARLVHTWTGIVSGQEFKLLTMTKTKHGTGSLSPFGPVLEYGFDYHPILFGSTPDVRYEALESGQLIATTQGAVGAILVETPIESTGKGPGDPLDGLDLSLIERSSNDLVVGTQWSIPKKVTFPGQDAVLADEIRIVADVVLGQASGFALLSVVGVDIGSMTLAKEEISQVDPLVEAGIEHLGLGFAVVTSTGDGVHVSNLGPSGNDGVAARIASKRGWGARVITPDAQSLPDGASIKTVLRGKRVSGASESLIALRKEKTGAGQFRMSIDAAPALLLAGGRVEYEVYSECTRVGKYTSDPVPVTVVATGLKGPGDPLDGIDVSLIDRSSDRGVVRGSTRLQHTASFAFEGGPTFEGDELRYAIVGSSEDVEEISEVQVYGTSMNSFVLQAPVTADGGEVTVFELPHSPLGFATIADSAGALVASGIGTSCIDGFSVDLGSASGWQGEWSTDDLAALPFGAFLSTSVLGKIGGMERELVRTTKRKSATTPDDVLYTLAAEPDIFGASPLITYEAFLGGELVLSVVASEAPVLVSPVLRRGPGDPLGGIDLSVIDKSSRGPTITGSVWNAPQLVTLPGSPPVVADELRLSVSPNTVIDDLSRITVVGARMGTVRLVVEEVGRGETAPDGSIEHTALGFARVDDSGPGLTVTNIGSSGKDGIAARVTDRMAWRSRIATPAASTLPDGASLERTLRGRRAGHPVEDLVKFTRKKLSTDEYLLSVEPSTALAASGGLVQYEVFQDCDLVERFTLPPDSIIVTAAIAKGPGDPLDGIDVSLIDKGARAKIAAGGTRFDHTLHFAFRGGPVVEGNEIHYSVVDAAEEIEAMTDVEIRGKHLGSIQLQESEVGSGAELEVFDLRHRALGFASVRTEHGSLHIEDLEESCLDGVTIDVEGSSGWRGETKTPNSSSSSASSKLAMKTIASVGGKSTELFELGKRKESGTQSREVLELRLNKEIYGGSPVVRYEALLAGRVVEAVLSTPGEVVVEPPIARAPEDPLNGIDTSSMDRESGRASVSTKYKSPRSVRLPGVDPVAADEIRATASATGPKPTALENIVILGRKVGAIELANSQIVPSTAEARFTVTSPNGGETWVAGRSVTIRWTGSDLADLSLSSDGGVNWLSLASSVGGGFENEWTLLVPSITTFFALVAVSPAGVPPSHVSADHSDAVFRIVLPSETAPAAHRSTPVRTGEAADDRLGEAVAGIGDFDGDGFDDLAMGAPGFATSEPNTGRVYVHFGGVRATPVTALVLEGLTPGEEFGSSLAGIGDVNADGLADLLVGAPANESAGVQSGRAYVFLGTHLAGTMPDLVLDPASTNERFGSALAGGGDLNGDGHPDFVVGAPADGPGSSAPGSVYVYFGGPAIDAQPDLVINGSQPGESFGAAVAIVPDFNGDGFDDLLVGAPTHSGSGVDSGRAYLFLGGAQFEPTFDLMLSGEAPQDRFGASLAAIGDADGDGFGDFLIGAPGNSAMGVASGRAYLFLGAMRFEESPPIVLSGARPGDAFGTVVSGGADLNADGFADFAVGALGSSIAGPGSGRVEVHLGGLGGTSGLAYFVDGPSPGAGFGSAIAVAGDFHADGFGDLLLGAPGLLSSAGQAMLVDMNRYHLLSPSGGETWQVGSMQSITWLGAEPADLWLSVDGGATYALLRSHVGSRPVNALQLQVPHLPSRFSKIRLVPSDHTIVGHDETDSLFTIRSSVELIDFSAELREDAVALSWTAAARIGPDGIRGYRLYRRDSSGQGPGTRIGPDLLQTTGYLDGDGMPESRYSLFAVNGFSEALFLGETRIAPIGVLTTWPSPYLMQGDLTIRFVVSGPHSSSVQLDVFDLRGRLVQRIISTQLDPGIRFASWNGSDRHGRQVSAGSYFLRLAIDGQHHTHKLLLLR
jgi:hypothetical protein